MEKSFKLENIKAYQIASDLSDYVWDIVCSWDWLAKRTLGTQFINAIDSIAGNIAEGFGRYHKKDKAKFYYNARASLFESAHWCKKSYKRKLITHEDKEYILIKLRSLPKEINTLIRMTLDKLRY